MDGAGRAEASTLEVDGVRLDAETLCCINEAGTPIPVSKLTVRELQAELNVRRAPAYGSKKEMVNRLQASKSHEAVHAWLSECVDTDFHRLQKARKLAAASRDATQAGEGTSPVGRAVRAQPWSRACSRPGFARACSRPGGPVFTPVPDLVSGRGNGH